MRKSYLFIVILSLLMFSISVEALDYNVTLNASSSMADLTLLITSVPYRESIMRWNISSLPDNIIGFPVASLCLYVVYVPNSFPSSSGSVNLSYSRGVWNESSSVSVINQLVMLNSTNESRPNNFTINQYACMNVNISNYISNAYSNNKSPATFRFELEGYAQGNTSVSTSNIMNVIGWEGLSVNRTVTFEDMHNHGGSGFLPYLNITYTLANASVVVIDYPINTTYYSNSTPLYWHIIGNATNCTAFMDNLTFNVSGNITLNLTVGNHNVSIRCADLLYPQNISTPVTYFSYRIPCTEDWRSQFTDCLFNQSQITYVDTNHCNTSFNFSILSPVNGTYLNCTSSNISIPGNVLWDYTYILGDLTMLRTNGTFTNYSNIVRWNLSSLQANTYLFNDVELCKYVKTNSNFTLGNIEMKLTSDPWDESTVVGSLNALNVTNTTSVPQPNNLTQSQYACFNVTQFMTQTYNMGAKEMTIMLDIPVFDSPPGFWTAKSDAYARMGQFNTAGLSQYISFEDRHNHEGTGFRPYMNISYIQSNVAVVTIDMPQNVTYSNLSIPLNWRINGTASGCMYHLDGNNVSIGSNITLNISTGQHSLNISCHDYSFNQNVTSQTVHFTAFVPCTEDWRPSYGNCINDLMLVTYTDAHICGTTLNLSRMYPPDNSYVDCNRNSTVNGSFVIQYKTYPYFLITDNPEYIFVELSDGGNKTLIPNITLNMKSQTTNITQSFNLTKDVNLTRYEIFLSFNESDVGDNFTLEFIPNVVSYGTAEGLLYIRNSTCQIDIRLWKDKNQSSPYLNDFGFIIARRNDAPAYTLYDYLILSPFYDKHVAKYVNKIDTWGKGGNLIWNLEESPFEWFNAHYSHGQANLTLYDSGDYEFRLVDGSIIFPVNYGRYLIEERGSIDADIGTYRITCNPQAIQTRDYYVSPFDMNFTDSWLALFWVIIIFLIALILAVIVISATGSFQLGAIAFFGSLIVLASIFFGVRLFSMSLFNLFT
jgi:hypothetical protein